jgi:hypothetical protein
MLIHDPALDFLLFLLCPLERTVVRQARLGLLRRSSTQTGSQRRNQTMPGTFQTAEQSPAFIIVEVSLTRQGGCHNLPPGRGGKNVKTGRGSMAITSIIPPFLIHHTRFRMSPAAWTCQRRWLQKLSKNKESKHVPSVVCDESGA